MPNTVTLTLTQRYIYSDTVTALQKQRHCHYSKHKDTLIETDRMSPGLSRCPTLFQLVTPWSGCVTQAGSCQCQSLAIDIFIYNGTLGKLEGVRGYACVGGGEEQPLVGCLANQQNTDYRHQRPFLTDRHLSMLHLGSEQEAQGALNLSTMTT